jgi:hypothetical protein
MRIMTDREAALLDLISAHGRVQSAKDLIAGAKSRNRSQEYIEKLEHVLTVAGADLEHCSRRFVEAYTEESLRSKTEA